MDLSLNRTSKQHSHLSCCQLWLLFALSPCAHLQSIVGKHLHEGHNYHQWSRTPLLDVTSSNYQLPSKYFTLKMMEWFLITQSCCFWSVHLPNNGASSKQNSGKGIKNKNPCHSLHIKPSEEQTHKQTMLLRIFFKLLSHTRIQPGRPLHIYHTKALDYLLSNELVEQPT